MMKPHRVPLSDFPDVVLHAPELVIKGHPQYRPAKVGEALAAEALVADSIPMALAEELSRRLALPVHDAIVQLNSVGHTGADGFKRLANLAGFIRGQGGEILGATVFDRKALFGKAGFR